MKGLVRTLLTTALAILAVALTASPAAGSEDRRTAPLQLALGDSWAAGFGATVPSEGGYVPQLHDALADRLNCSGQAPRGAEAGCRHLELLNVAVGGATTPSMVASQYPQALPILEARGGNLNPRDDVELVTVHTGGNDVTNPIIAACVFGAGDCQATVAAELAAFEADLTGALATLREAAGEAMPIVIGTYDNPIATCFLAAFPGTVALADTVLEGGSGVPRGLHDIIRAAATEQGILVAEVYGDLGPQDWLGGSDCLHPDDSGYDKVTIAFLEALGVG